MRRYRFKTMLHPVGNLPPVIYWRRRIFLLVLPLVLLLVVLVALVRSGGQSNATGTSGPTGSSAAPAAVASAAGSTPSSSAAALSSAAGSTASESPNAHTRAQSTRAESTGTVSTRPTSSATAGSSSASAANSGSASSVSSTPGCAESDLHVEAVTSSASLSARSGPTLYLQVTNISERACHEDLADKQIVLTVRSRDARIWGSHDCKVISGKDKVTLAPGMPVRRGIVWSGRTSTPGCAGTRPYAQPGSYELYASLSGQHSGPTAFTITS